MEWIRERIRLAVPLLAGAYLGFFVFAVVMGADVLDVGWMAAGAAVSLLVLIAYAVATHLGIYPVHPDRPLARSQQTERERRGW